MKKVLAGILCLIVILSCFNYYVSFGASRDIRIGLERHYIGVSSIPVSDTLITVQIGDGKKYSVSEAYSYSVAAVSGSYFDSGMTFNTYSEANRFASEFNGEAIPALKDSGWGLYFTKSGSTEDVTQETVTENTESTEVTTQQETFDDVSGFKSITLGANAVKFASGGITCFIADGSDSVHISTGSGIVNLGGYSYRNVIEIYRNASTVNAVNILPVEDYLLGVVTSEMPQSWPIEAIKAQAVAARTYAQHNLGKHGKYDLCDSTDCQQYNGVNGESAAGKQAVNDTKGVMAYYNGSLITATYFSSSGGHTQSAVDVWGTDIPYLVGVKELNETGGKQWVRTFTYDEITQLCKSASYDVGTVTSVSVGETLEGGLVKTMIIEGTNGTVTLEREDIRNLFKNSAEGSLYSRNFKISNTSVKSNNVYVIAQDNEGSVDINVVSAVAANGIVGPVQNSNIVIVGSEGEYVLSSGENNMSESQDSVTITGSGYGHGVGMSQYGAKGMAELGYTYDEILKYYYTGIDVY